MTSQSPTSRIDRSQGGFSLVEALIAVVVLLLLFSAATNGLNQTATLSKTVGNRTEMHGSTITLSGGVVTGAGTAPVNTSAGLFNGAQVVVGTGAASETVTLTNVAANAISGVFAKAHAAGEPVQIFGGFGTGVVPPSMANGSTGTVLKLYGDVNDDGQMQYIEYTCDTANNKLYRNVMAWNVGAKPALTPEMILLNNIVPNPGNSPCFTYQSEVVTGNTYVTGVAVTLSVRSQQKDHFSKAYQQATKTLLNVSPRNIFLVWSMVSIGVTNRLQPMPPTILALLP
jgi:hypothetical protein